MTTILEASAAIVAALEAVPNLTVFAGGVPDDQVMPRDDGGRVKPYAVVYIGAGRTSSDRHGGMRPAANVPLDLSIPLQVTAAAGTYEGALWAVGKVRLALSGVQLLDAATTSRLREDADAGRAQEDKSVPSDVRWYLPMQYRFTTTT